MSTLYNPTILLLHVSWISLSLLLSLRFGKEYLIAWLAVLALAMNLFVLKQVTLFHLKVTASEALGVGYLLGLNLIQEFFGRSAVKRMAWISLWVSGSFIILSQLHLAYQPNEYDLMHPSFALLLTPMPRILLASFCSFGVIQLLDISFFAFLRKKMEGHFFTGRVLLSLFLSQTLDTVLFSFLGLYGLVEALSEIILFSLGIKLVVIFLTAPFISLSKKMVPHELSV